MYFSYETLLILGIYVFYIYDSALLVSSNQVIFSEGFGFWSFSFPSGRLSFLRKLIYLPNLLLPFSALFIQSWPSKSNQITKPNIKKIQNFLRLLLPLRLMVMMASCLLLIVLPVMILNHVSTLFLLANVGLIYVLNLFMVIYICIKKVNFGLTNKDLFEIAFDCMACPSFAINAVRKVSLKQYFYNSPLVHAEKFLNVNDPNYLKVL